jgi:SOS-response transcriptional repressor LexA
MSKKKADETQSKAANVRVAKDIATTAKQAAALWHQRLEDFIVPLLNQAGQLAEEEIAARGVDAVAERTEALKDLEKASNLGPFNVDQSVSRPLVRLAGSVPTSMAKLLDPHLRDLVTRRFHDGLRKVGPLIWQRKPFKLPVYGCEPAGSAFSEQGEYDFESKFGGGDTYMLRVTDQSTTGNGIVPDDHLVIRRGSDAEPGAVLVTWEDGQAVLRRLRADVDPKSGRTTLRLYPLKKIRGAADYEASRDSIIGVLLGVVRDY